MENEKEPFERSFESLEELADTISDVLQGPVTIEDANHKLIAYSSHQAQTDSVRISTIIGKRVPDKVIQALWRDGVIQKLMKSEEPLVIPAIGEVGLGDRIAIAIRKDHEILGYIWTVLGDGGSPSDVTFRQLIQAAKAARTKLLQLRMKHRKTEQSYQEFLRRLLSGDMKSDLEVRQQADKLGLELPAFFCAAVLPFPSEITERQQQQLHYLITTLQKRIVLHAVDSEALVMLEAHPQQRLSGKAAPAIAVLTEQMTQRFDCAPLQGGCGAVYGDYARVYQSYHEALTVIRLRQKFPEALAAVHYYADLGFYRLLPEIVLHQQEHYYDNDYLHQLEAYDLGHNGDLLHTLYVYLDHDSNLKESAEALHIHENTLSYRLKRISHISGLDLTRMDQKVTCYLELKAKRFRS
ncbi:DNA-binding transcriptional regulator, PucR family [Paenibacillus sp. UNCCL117]|uniref:PucR family transcriptional regulator n=1 Tax=unclassified Paenibacillus TaxID=185978 RepID=UPI000883C629|nr:MULTISPECIES: helix-turn-helix domain-containing protein [unclassified Paenibacillus]SDE67503.1 DNA-binding transcriptional regulator, PucR family [Paenibacillus sp. cl123]SFW70732.1 DNA-binding transcriptional regulator, PucR family [Paenibacillus sp. UNCCL117]